MGPPEKKSKKHKKEKQNAKSELNLKPNVTEEEKHPPKSPKKRKHASPARESPLPESPSKKKKHVSDFFTASPKQKVALDASTASPKKKIKFDESITVGSENSAAESKQKPLQNCNNKGAETSDTSAEPRKNDIFGWPQKDVKKLIERLILETSNNIKSTKSTNAPQKINWDKVKFDKYSADECLNMWLHVDSNQRKFRTLAEILEDAAKWVEKPHYSMNNFRRIFPDMPKQPMSAFFIFSQEKKDDLRQKYPDLSFKDFSKVVAEEYKNLKEKKKKKYEKKAAKLKEAYKENLLKFYEEHPEAKPEEPQKKPTQPKAVKVAGPEGEKPRKPITLYLAEKLVNSSLDPNLEKTELTDKYKEKWKKLSDKKKLKYIVAAYEAEVKYRKAVKDYNAEHENSIPLPKNSVISKEEFTILDKSRGKPVKPPTSAYALFFSQKMSSPEMAGKSNSEKLQKIAGIWKDMGSVLQHRYKTEVKELQKNFEKDFEAFLERLSPEEKDYEMERYKPAGKRASPKKSPNKKAIQMTLDNIVVSSKPTVPKPQLIMGEPEPPPGNELEFFSLQQRKENPQISQKEIIGSYKKLSDVDRAALKAAYEKCRKQYMDDYEKFLNSFEPQQLLLYTRQKVNPDLSTKKSDDEDEEEEEVEEEIASLAKTNNEDSDESSDEKEEEPKKSAGQVLSPAKKNNKATKESSSDESSDDESQSTKQVSTQLIKKLSDSGTSDSESSSDSDDS
nr:PREDICTED: nucleolar transcription factor 1-A-like [Bemisia tabaci]XP_018912998.1 PREDICTED: nucleolar transcription factor 1-A-like [Bemisia tabaci]